MRIASRLSNPRGAPRLKVPGRALVASALFNPHEGRSCVLAKGFASRHLLFNPRRANRHIGTASKRCKWRDSLARVGRLALLFSWLFSVFLELVNPHGATRPSKHRTRTFGSTPL